MFIIPVNIFVSRMTNKCYLWLYDCMPPACILNNSIDDNLEGKYIDSSLNVDLAPLTSNLCMNECYRC
jgi:hypothetical protein